MDTMGARVFHDLVDDIRYGLRQWMTASIKRGALELHRGGHRALLLGGVADFLRRRQGLRLSAAVNIQEYLLCQRLLHGEAGELET